jgi:hypothetical protein
MEVFLVLLKFFGGLILLIGIGVIIGRQLKLDKYLESNKKAKKSN